MRPPHPSRSRNRDAILRWVQDIAAFLAMIAFTAAIGLIALMVEEAMLAAREKNLGIDAAENVDGASP
tara:strand:+ start:3342 stop:3545 length:204 start_codon:yes stop_codon:yes gene_type:complete